MQQLFTETRDKEEDEVREVLNEMGEKVLTGAMRRNKRTSAEGRIKAERIRGRH